jgi:site-specific DNA recombinase
MKRAILMSRVSSDEQAKGYSLDVQINSLQNYCERNKVVIVSTFKEDHSAKSFERPAFKQFLSNLKKTKGQVDLLLFTTWDRFSRNTAEAYGMINQLKKLGVTAQATEQPIDLSIPENKAMLAFYLALPEIENDRRSIKILGGIRGARKAGRFTSHAPIGYKNGRDDFNKPLIVPSEKATLISSAFIKLASGIAMVDVRIELKEKGLDVSKSQFSLMFRNPLYKGYLRVPAGENEPEYLTKGVHQAIVSEQIFDNVQDILESNNKKRRHPRIQTLKPELPLRGNLLCSKCGSKLTGSGSRSRTKVVHYYYHCNHCHEERYRASAINDTIQDILEDFKISKEARAMYKQVMSEVLGSTDIEIENKKRKLKDFIKQQEERLVNLEELLLDNKMPYHEYSTLKSKTDAMKLKHQLELNNLLEHNLAFEKKMEKALNDFRDVATVYKIKALGDKANLISSIFPEKLSFDGNQCRTTRINEVLRLALAIDKGFRKNKTGQLSNKLVLSRVVEDIGFEPTTSCMPCKRSSQMS